MDVVYPIIPGPIVSLGIIFIVYFFVFPIFGSIINSKAEQRISTDLRVSTVEEMKENRYGRAGFSYGRLENQLGTITSTAAFIAGNVCYEMTGSDGKLNQQR